MFAIYRYYFRFQEVLSLLIVFKRVFYLEDYGAGSEKCIFIWSNAEEILNAVEMPDPDELRLFQEPPTPVGERWWCHRDQRFKFNGNAVAIKESQFYPVLFGREFVPD